MYAGFSACTTCSSSTSSPYLQHERCKGKRVQIPERVGSLRGFKVTPLVGSSDDAVKLQTTVNKGFSTNDLSPRRESGYGFMNRNAHKQVFTVLSSSSQKKDEVEMSDSEEEEEVSEELLDISHFFKKGCSIAPIMSATIIEKIESVTPIEQIVDFIDGIFFQEGDEALITYIFAEGEQHFLTCYPQTDLEKFVEKILSKFPNTDETLSDAIERNFSDQLIFRIIERTRLSRRHLSIVLEKSDSPDVLLEVVDRVFVTEMSDVNAAIYNGWSFECVEKIFDKVKAYELSPWYFLFPFQFIDIHRISWEGYSKRPKPYLTTDNEIPLPLLKKFLTYFPIHTLPILDNFIGCAREEVVWQIVDRVEMGSESVLEYILLCGYSEKFVLHVFNKIEDRTLKSDNAVAIARLRGYSDSVVTLIKKKSNLG